MPSPFVTCNTITVCSQIISVHPALISSSWININSILCVFLVFLSPIKSDSYHHFCQLQTGGYTLDIVMVAKCFGEFRLRAPKLHSFHYKNNKFTSNLSYRHNKILDISCIFFISDWFMVDKHILLDAKHCVLYLKKKPKAANFIIKGKYA